MNWKVLIGFGLLLGLVNCTVESPLEIGVMLSVERTHGPKIKVDGQIIESSNVKSRIEVIDSIRAVDIDTAQLKGKREFILREFNLVTEGLTYLYDTLLDVNFDSHLDFVIGTHTMSGSGLANGMEVFIYDEKNDCYRRDSMLSFIRNPSFFFEENKMSSFYISSGSGSGEEFEWIDDHWVKTKEISVVNHGRSTIWKVSDLFTGVEEQVNLPYQMIPPTEVLKNKFKSYERN